MSYIDMIDKYEDIMVLAIDASLSALVGIANGWDSDTIEDILLVMLEDIELVINGVM